ncbi:MAG: DMT family transporter [Burkholderiales bacterium]
MSAVKVQTLPVIALLGGAIVWGLIWYPYRLFQKAEISGELASFVTYGIAFAFGLVFFRLRKLRERKLILLGIGLTAGWTNLAYILATLHGEVMRVLLLFYLAPLWTVFFSHLILGEVLNSRGALVILLSFAGAIIMLWQPGTMPLPENFAEWIGLSSGFAFALSNVLARKAQHHDAQTKALAVFAGVMLLSLPPALAQAPIIPPLVETPVSILSLLIAVGLVVFGINVVVQYGLAHTTANRAIVIFLFELVVAAIAAYLLVGETMETREWIGGALIVAASLFSGRLERRQD